MFQLTSVFLQKVSTRVRVGGSQHAIVGRPIFSAAAMASTVATKLGTAMLSVVSSFWGNGNRAKTQVVP
jgi:IMP dehydrogenase/GMP reductase